MTELTIKGEIGTALPIAIPLQPPILDFKTPAA
jgi:hypothetical protein